MTQSPLFPDIVPEPDETLWDIYDNHFEFVAQFVGRKIALEHAQRWADDRATNMWIGPGAEIEDSSEELYQKIDDVECVRPGGLPW